MYRQALEWDIPELLKVAEAYYEFGPFEAHGLEYNRGHMDAYIRQMMDMPDQCLILVAETGGRIVGTVGAVLVQWFMAHNQKIAGEHWWFVHPAHRGQGIAQGLLDGFEAWARKHGAACLKMGSLPNEHQARLDGWYKTKGFMAGEHTWAKRL